MRIKIKLYDAPCSERQVPYFRISYCSTVIMVFSLVLRTSGCFMTDNREHFVSSVVL